MLKITGEKTSVYFENFNMIGDLNDKSNPYIFNIFHAAFSRAELPGLWS